MKKILVILAAVALLTTARNDVEETTSPFGDILQVWLELQAQPATDKRTQRIRYRMWDMLCFELRDVDCTGMTPPSIMLFKPNPLRPGLAGYYNGDNVIYIRSNLRGEAREEVLAHEMSHFVDNELGLLPSLPVFMGDTKKLIGLCMSEKRAWAVSDAYHTKYRNFRQIVGEDWTRWYKHCTPHKDVLYPKV